MRTPTRRLGAVVVTTTLSTALALGGALAPAPAQAASNPASQSAADWLGRQLTNGLVHNDQFGGFDDYGLTLDVFFALQQIGAGAGDRSAILAAFAKDPGAYISAFGTESAGGTGKLATAVELGQQNPRAFGGKNLVTRLEGMLSTRSGEVGRGVDTGSGEYSNTIGQAWIVRALAGAGSAKKTAATSFLLKQQCAAGFFRLTLEKATATSHFTCDAASSGNKAASIDATALAVQALEVAKAHGVGGLDADIAHAAGWLTRKQAANGSFVDQGTANSNSTGLVAATLASLGRTGAAGSAAGWVLGHQVTAAVARGSALTHEVGAVAYDAAALTAGKKDGITPELRDQWRRATAQAAPALDALLPDASLAATGPSGYRRGGSVATFRTAGLAPGEHFTTHLGTVKTFHGVAGSRGIATATFLLPKATHTYTVTTTGSRPGRSGRTTVKALWAKRLSVSLSRTRLPKRAVERVTVRGLASHEPFRLTYRGTRIWHGTASATGVATHSFHVGRSAGRKKLVSLGRFDNRRATSYLTVR